MNKMSDYNTTVEFLFSSLPMYQRTGQAAYKANLDNTHALDKALGHPHRNFKTIHIAGTNGKGSVSHMLASIFQEAGYKTGLYTSPHLMDFRERIRVGGKMIREEQVVNFVNKIRDEIDVIKPSFFEMTVAMAFDHFAEEKVDIAIIETGMGGRLDSTNIITPLASLITSISIDHALFLGNTELLIAREKGGIIKNGVPVVIGKNDQEICRLFSEMAEERQANILFAERERSFSYLTFSQDQLACFHFRNFPNRHPEVIRTDLPGRYQHENISVVLTTIGLLQRSGWNIPQDSVNKGFSKVKKNTSLLGRWDILGANPRIIADTAHNKAGILAVMEQLLEIPSKKLHIIWGMVNDKQVEEIFDCLPGDATYYFTEPSIPRAMPVSVLTERALALGFSGKPYKSVPEAYRAALESAGPEDTIFVGGSTFVVGDLFVSLYK
ncbi:MAG: folylpolyglutamate synthase/dihydrofolate synthase family protein [Bacteroidales bacterium]